MLPESVGPLLTILLSSIFAAYDVIRIAWASKQPYTNFDISFFARV